MTTPHLICLDIDGTTVDHDGHLHEPVREAVRAVVDAGHHVTLATGRAIIGTLPVLEALGLTHGYAVCANGAITLRVDPDLPDGYEVLEAVTFDPAPALRVLREEFPTALVAVEELGVGFKVSAPFPDGELDGEPRVVPFEELMAEPVTRLTIRDPDSTSEDFDARTERIGLHGVEYAVGWSAWLDITPEGVSKAAALEGVRRRLGVEPAATVAVGDQRNDLEMLRWAARGVAMDNAPDEVKAAADEVTGHVDDDGLVAVLRSLP
ncbi:HAD family hydrolase [Phycicoccus sonneratiae]|uniref:HAD family phosphatase n=1 Tax=Phycicoccus sonneratiae TaxID=2807628 RepID=A0ABS2CPH1_9MICO|nr:HAD family hydrolase [Phycicoccus sonneraticus]MBM6401695.1 HAD family phosphatase [Phycicoccus sonneraticus]